MIDVNGRQYALALLDTNMLSDMLKDKGGFGRRVSERVELGSSCIAVDIHSIQEVRRRDDLFEQLIDFMVALPVLIVKSGGQLIDGELDMYATRMSVDPILLAPCGISGPPGISKASLLRAAFKSKGFVTPTEELESGLDALWQLFLSMSEEWKSAGLQPSESTIRAYATIVAERQIEFRCPGWLESLEDPLDLDMFPSIKSGAYTAFLRFASDQRRPRRSDVLDLALASAFPYVDKAGIEAHQAEMLKKTSRLDSFLDHLDVFTVGSLGRTG